MVSLNYMKQRSDGNIQMNIAELPDKVFIKAIKVKDIAKARILTASEKKDSKPGSPDVKIMQATGTSTMISRSQLSSLYRHSNMKKIKLAVMNSGTNYVVVRPCNIEYKVMKLPDNCFGIFNGKSVKPGNYIVAKANEDGSLDRSTIGIVSPTMFNKMFKIPLQPIIQKHLNGTGSTIMKLFNRKPLTNRKPVRSNISLGNDSFTPRIDTSSLGIDPASITIGAQSTNNNPVNSNNKTSKLSIEKTPINNDNTKYKFTIINQIVSVQNGQLVGYTIVELATQRSKAITPAILAKLAKDRLVDNVMYVQKENGTAFIKGNGIVLNNLPKVIE